MLHLFGYVSIGVLSLWTIPDVPKAAQWCGWSAWHISLGLSSESLPSLSPLASCVFYQPDCRSFCWTDTSIQIILDDVTTWASRNQWQKQLWRITEGISDLASSFFVFEIRAISVLVRWGSLCVFVSVSVRQGHCTRSRQTFVIMDSRFRVQWHFQQKIKRQKSDLGASDSHELLAGRKSTKRSFPSFLSLRIAEPKLQFPKLTCYFVPTKLQGKHSSSDSFPYW